MLRGAFLGRIHQTSGVRESRVRGGARPFSKVWRPPRSGVRRRARTQSRVARGVGGVGGRSCMATEAHPKTDVI